VARLIGSAAITFDETRNILSAAKGLHNPMWSRRLGETIDLEIIAPETSAARKERVDACTATNSINGLQGCKPFVFDVRENNPKVAVQIFNSMRLSGRRRGGKAPMVKNANAAERKRRTLGS
jgi:hypothetical protein